LYESYRVRVRFGGLVLLGPAFLLLVFAHAILLDRQIFVVLVFLV
ncbi:hypothetical protein T12_10569, partial [Trichinella patagoniensis]